MNFTGLIQAVDFVDLLAALGALAALLISVTSAIWGYNQVLQWFQADDEVDWAEVEQEDYDAYVEAFPDDEGYDLDDEDYDDRGGY